MVEYYTRMTERREYPFGKKTLVGGILIAATVGCGISESINSRFGHGEVVCSEPSAVVFDASGGVELPQVPVINGRFVDPQDGRAWRMDEKYWEISGKQHGVFQGWVDEESVPWADEEPGSCWGRFAHNDDDRGIVGFRPETNPRR